MVIFCFRFYHMWDKARQALTKLVKEEKIKVQDTIFLFKVRFCVFHKAKYSWRKKVTNAQCAKKFSFFSVKIILHFSHTSTLWKASSCCLRLSSISYKVDHKGKLLSEFKPYFVRKYINERRKKIVFFDTAFIKEVFYMYGRTDEKKDGINYIATFFGIIWHGSTFVYFMIVSRIWL